MSGSAMADGLISILTSASAFDSSNVSKNDFGTIEQAATCALIVRPWSWEAERFTFGNEMKVIWDLLVECYIKDSGTSTTDLNNLWKINQEIFVAVQNDASLNNSACDALPRRGQMHDDLFEALGSGWLRTDIIVEAWETI